MKKTIPKYKMRKVTRTFPERVVLWVSLFPPKTFYRKTTEPEIWFKPVWKWMEGCHLGPQPQILRGDVVKNKPTRKKTK